MVGVVQWLERQIVVLDVVGSNPITHPNYRDVAKSVRHQTLTLAFVGSSPAIPAKHGPLAQVVEHLTFNQGVRSSSLRWLTSKTLQPQGLWGFQLTYRSNYYRISKMFLPYIEQAIGGNRNG